MTKRNTTPAQTDEEQENKLIALAYKQAEKQLADGTASSQIVTHFLKHGTKKMELELEQARLQNRLLEEKIQSERSGQQIAESVNQVIAALQRYNGFPQGDGYVND